MNKKQKCGNVATFFIRKEELMKNQFIEEEETSITLNEIFEEENYQKCVHFEVDVYDN